VTGAASCIVQSHHQFVMRSPAQIAGEIFAMPIGPQLRLYILGKLDKHDPQPHRLTTLAEFRDGRALERVELDGVQKDKLNKSVGDLRVFLMRGEPPFSVQDLRLMGKTLFQLIVRGRVSELLNQAVGPSREIVPMELIVEDPTIGGWPWEYAYDEPAGFLCKAFNPISRGIFGPNPGALPPPRSGPIRILFVFGASRTDPEAKVNAQEDRLRHVFKRINEMQGVEMTFLQAIGPEELDQELADNPYDIFHFFGHAGLDADRDQGYLIFDRGNDSKKKRYYAEDLGPSLAKKGLRLAFLNACETAVAGAEVDPGRSALAATLLSYGVPAVIATQFLMPDNSAHFLAENIYRALLRGATIVEAMRAGRRSMQYSDDERHPDWGIPVLYSSCPDLIVFPGEAGR
jgi:CHAT domain